MDGGFQSVWLGGGSIVFRVHAARRMFQRTISEQDVMSVLRNGKTIEEYGDDYPFPSFLLCGVSDDGRVLHVVASYDETTKTIFIITAYLPDEKKWGDNFTRRHEP